MTPEDCIVQVHAYNAAPDLATSSFSDHSNSSSKMALVLEPQAKVLYNILGALFDHSDGYFEPKGIGLWTMEKERAVMVETDQAGLAEGLHTPSPSLYSSSSNT